MKIRLFSRTPRGVLPTRPARWAQAAWPVCAILAILLLNAWGTAADELEADRVLASEAMRVAAYEQGRRDGQAELAQAIQEGMALPQRGCSGVGLAGVRP